MDRRAEARARRRRVAATVHAPRGAEHLVEDQPCEGRGARCSGKAGLAKLARAQADGRLDAAYDGQKTVTVPEDLAAALAKNARAKAFFATLDSANRYAVLFRVHTARKAETRARRIEALVAMLASHEKIHGG